MLLTSLVLQTPICDIHCFPRVDRQSTSALKKGLLVMQTWLILYLSTGLGDN